MKNLILKNNSTYLLSSEGITAYKKSIKLTREYRKLKDSKKSGTLSIN